MYIIKHVFQTLLTLSSKTFGNINIKSFCEKRIDDACLGYEFENYFNLNIDIKEHKINNKYTGFTSNNLFCWLLLLYHS